METILTALGAWCTASLLASATWAMVRSRIRQDASQRG